MDKKIIFTKVFNDKGAFEAYYKAEKFLKSRGFSVGSMQAGDPIGIMFGDYHIMKWRNLRQSDRDALHGQIIGDKRNGPVTINLFSHLMKLI